VQQEHRLINSRGQVFLRAGRYDEAFDDFRQALVLCPDYAPAYLNRGVVWLLRQEYDLALADFEQGDRLFQGRQYRIARNVPGATISLVRALAHLGKGEEARAHQIWLRELLPLGAGYRDAEWVIGEHQVLPPLRGLLEALLESLPDRPTGWQGPVAPSRGKT